MVASKNIDFEENIVNIAEVFKALGDPVRIQIMNILLDKETCSCVSLVDKLPLELSAVKNHLLELKKANLVNITFTGKKSIYCIEKENLNILSNFLNNYVQNIDALAFSKKVDNKTISLTQVKNVKVESLNSSKTKKTYSYLKQYNYEFPHKKDKNYT